MKPFVIVGLIGLLLIDDTTASAQTGKIHISAPSKSLSWFPLHLAREQGIFRAEGLEVDYVIMKPESSYDLAASSWSSTGAPSSEGVRIAMEEIRAELKLETPPDAAKAFDWSFLRN